MKTMPYYKWEKLTTEEQNDYIAKGILPYVPQVDLRGNLLQSHMIIVNGERYWEIERHGGGKKIFPEFITKAKSEFTMWCKFNPVWGDYRTKVGDT